MSACSICKNWTHNSRAHKQECVVCGGGAKLLPRAEDVDPTWKCEDEAEHDRIRRGFGNPNLVDKARQAPPTVAELQKEQRRLL